MKPQVYIADLRYNYSGVLANDCMPLGVAYMKAVMDRDLPEVDSRLFAYPDRLSEALRQASPDILMVSNYVWNEQLSLHFLRLVKERYPDCLTVMGGPNISIEPERQIEWFRKHPFIDLYVLGEGDFLATEIAKQHLDAGLSVAQTLQRDIPSTLCRRPDGSVVRQPMWNRAHEVDEIPSPWLSGLQDEFFDGKLAPMIETNRGCPFKCTFCVQGTDWYTKVHYFGEDRVKEELTYIARQIKRLSPNMGTLRIADANYGMYSRDTDISAHIGSLQKEFGFPTFIDATTGKNRPERVIKSVEQTSGALVLYQAVQSLDDNVLRNIKRQNIKLEAYEQLHIYMRGRGLRSNSDLIVGLPGETLQSHVSALHKILDTGINQMHNLQLLLLKGSELETLDSRKTFKYKERFRVGPKNFGVYDGRKVFDTEEIVVETDTLSFDDYIMSRKYHLACSVFWNNSWFEDAVQFVDRLAIRRSELFEVLLAAMERDTGVVGDFLKAFVSETKGELFPTHEALVEFYSDEQNFERLCRGEIGDNLMYKYRARASFHIWPEICKLAMDAIRDMLIGRGLSEQTPDFAAFWTDFHRFVELKHANGYTADELAAPVTAEFQYDIAAWIADGYPIDSSPYRLLEPEPFDFKLSEAGERELRAAFKVWTAELKGLAKLVTRIQFGWQIRGCTRLKKPASVAVCSSGD